MRKFFDRIQLVARMSLEADRFLTIKTVATSIAYFLTGTIVGAVLLKIITNDVVDRNWSDAFVMSATLAGFQGVSFIIGRLHGRLYPLLQEKNREHYDRKILHLTASISGIEHYENPEYLNKLEELRNQPQVLAQMLAVTVQATSLIVQTIILVIVLAAIDLRLIVVPLFAVPAVLAMRMADAINTKALDETAEPSRLARQLFGMLTSSESAKELRMQRLEDELIRRHAKTWGEIDQHRRRAERKSAMLTSLGWLIFAFAFAGMVIIAVERAARGQATVGDVVLTVTLATQLNRQVVTVLEVVGRIVRNSRGIDRYLWLEEYADASARQGAGLIPPERLNDGLRLEEVSFRYPGTDVDVLHRANLRLPAGKVVAIVGENGAGKTTLVKLLTGMYEPTSGEITVDGTYLGDLDIKRWRLATSAAFQDFARFEVTVGESIGVGDLDHINDPAHLTAAALRAGADDMIDQLPMGLATMLGGPPEGTNLSGGQWQKLALSRAMMRQAPLLLLLDEPTASLDPLAERALFEKYAAWAAEAGRTTGAITVLISHRFTTVRAAHLIVVMDRGRIVEQGSHIELVAGNGLYAELYELQARQYR